MEVITADYLLNVLSGISETKTVLKKGQLRAWLLWIKGSVLSIRKFIE